VRVVAQVADLVDREETGSQVRAEPPLKRARRVLAGEVEDQIGGREQARRMAGEDRLMDEILGEHRFAEAVRCDDDDVFALGQEVEREDAFDRGAMDLRGPGPFEIGQRLVAAETCVMEPALDAVMEPGRELGVRELFEQDDGTPAFLGGAGDQIIEIGRRVDQAELPEVITERRRDRVE
jgi:hypothetical protein